MRFEIVAPIAQGDFASVYRARDRELGREVAIKQIHQQYLQDPRQLERFWQEAQLMARLQHPHITTIYDIVRERGWLVLELMQGNLTQMLNGRPIDLNDLRMAILYTAQALQYLEQNGVHHGDVKPSNLLVDKNNRIKLGDFGIARRIVGDHGSAIKGTTKYMAPEVASEQFGPVGPHSDLYSLGFSAYELMCGANFDALFPGLNVFGRDRQMAWMMWHSAADRRLPEIPRVLQGVPDDLAYVIQRLCEKDPQRRYRQASQVLDDLKRHATSPGPSPQELAQAADDERKAKRKRTLTLAAFGASLVLSLAMLFFPSGDGVKNIPEPALTSGGILLSIEPDESRIYLREDGDPNPKSLVLQAQDRILLNNEPVKLHELAEFDQVQVFYGTLNGKPYKEVKAARAKEEVCRGHVVAISSADSTLRIQTPDEEQPIELFASNRTAVQINGESQLSGRAMQFHDLRVGDELIVRYGFDHENHRVARQLQALRILSLAGVFVHYDSNQKQIETMIPVQANNKRGFPLAEGVKISINGQDRNGASAWLPDDLRPGDQLILRYHTHVLELQAKREVSASGVVTEIDLLASQLKIQDAERNLRSFELSPQCRLTVRNQSVGLTPGEVRVGDRIDLEFTTRPDSTLLATALRVEPADDPRAWLILVGQSEFDDRLLPALPHILRDLDELKAVFHQKYRMPEDQLLDLRNVSRVELEQALAGFLTRVGNQAQLICYFAGHGLRTADGEVVLASKESIASDLSSAGCRLSWLVRQLENIKTPETILLLDTCHESFVDATLAQPSSSEQAESLKESPRRPVSASIHLIASSDRGQRGHLTSDRMHGLFGTAIMHAFHGAADSNGDLRVSVAELYPYLVQELVRESTLAGKKQSPVYFPPDATPSRLSPEARQTVKQLLALLNTDKLDDGFLSEAGNLESVAASQPDIALSTALVLLKHGKYGQSLPLLERLARKHSDLAIIHQALAWQHFFQAKAADGIRDLSRMVETLPEFESDEGRIDYLEHAYDYAGALRSYAVHAIARRLDETQVAELDRLVATRGPKAVKAYQTGSARVVKAADDLTVEISKTTNAERRQVLEFDRKRLSYYLTIRYDAIAAYIVAGLNE